MSDAKLWHWNITILNSRVSGIDAKPIDYATGDMHAAYVTGMYQRRGDCIVEIETIASTRTDAERQAMDVFARDVPDDMRGR